MNNHLISLRFNDLCETIILVLFWNYIKMIIEDSSLKKACEIGTSEYLSVTSHTIRRARRGGGGKFSNLQKNVFVDVITAGYYLQNLTSRYSDEETILSKLSLVNTSTPSSNSAATCSLTPSSVNAGCNRRNAANAAWRIMSTASWICNHGRL